MPAPYSTDEVARAVIAAARARGSPLEGIEVARDERERVWVIRTRLRDVTRRRLTFPLASARGVYTPAEIAEHIVRDTWPFG